MFVVPFYTKPILPSLINWSLQPIALFLENRGKQICETDDPVAWLSENGFFLCFSTQNLPLGNMASLGNENIEKKIGQNFYVFFFCYMLISSI
jgi:hypothetical protein